MTGSTGRVRPTSRPVRLLGPATVAFVAAAVLLLVQPSQPIERLGLVQTTALFACGVVIVRRTQVPAIGWLLVVPGIVNNVLYVAPPLAAEQPDGWTAWLAPLPILGITCLGLLLLVFPTGRFPSTAARAAGALLVVAMGGAVVLAAVDVAGGPVDRDAAYAVLVAVFALVTLVALSVQVRRYRHRSRVEQLQLQWFVVAVAGQLLYPAMLLAGVDPSGATYFLVDQLAWSLWPAAVLVAITRYRLYEIDRLLSRTLAYSLVIGVLGVVFVVGVAGLTALLPARDDVAVVVTTLSVMALFTPLLRRVRDVVDRRFDRSRYEARQVVERFGRGIADVADTAEVHERLVAVLRATVAPATVAVWEPRPRELP